MKLKVEKPIEQREIKCLFLAKINKNYKPLARLTMQKNTEMELQITNIKLKRKHYYRSCRHCNDNITNYLISRNSVA